MTKEQLKFLASLAYAECSIKSIPLIDGAGLSFVPFHHANGVTQEAWASAVQVIAKEVEAIRQREIKQTGADDLYLMVVEAVNISPQTHRLTKAGGGISYQFNNGDIYVGFTIAQKGKLCSNGHVFNKHFVDDGYKGVMQDAINRMVEKVHEELLEALGVCTYEQLGVAK